MREGLKNLSLVLAVSLLAGCGQTKPLLGCRISIVSVTRSESDTVQSPLRLEAALEVSKTEQVRDFSGTLKHSGEKDEGSQITGKFYRYPDGSFDLVASTGQTRITIMPSNPFLQERKIQGVLMKEGEHVLNGTPVSASCQTAEKE